MSEGLLRVTPSCRIPLSEVTVRVSRSGGPGGQHANTSDTRVDVAFDVEASPTLGPRQRARLLERLGPIVRATASDGRSQARNRELALERLRRRLAGGLAVTKPRRATKPSETARRARLDAKRRRSQTKRRRARPTVTDDD